jgi:uncharacterized membrane protein YcaP (DUF421 family)
MTVAAVHWCITALRSRSSRIARLFDGTPLVLLDEDGWRTETMARMRLSRDDVMAVARDHDLRRLDDVRIASLERNGDLSVIPRGDSHVGG